MIITALQGDLPAGQNPAYALLSGLRLNKKTPLQEIPQRAFLLGKANYFFMPKSFSVFNISMVVLITVSEFSEMLLMPHCTRNLANSG